MVAKKRINPSEKKKPTGKKHNLKKVPLWLKMFVIGFSCGLLLHYIPQIDATAAKLSSCLDYPLKQKVCSSNCASYPLSNPVLEREGYVLAYDGRAKTALWVQEELSCDSIIGNTDRSQFQFCRDPYIPSIIQADLKDYKGSGFDRGHLAPAGDYRSNPEAMCESFFLSNISPQLPQFNRGYWRELEKYVRDLTTQYVKVKVITGPLYLPNLEENGKRYVKYQVIGENDVAVPTHFFKVIMIKDRGIDENWVYILPNEYIDPKTPLNKFLTSLDKIEKVSGIVFSR